MTDASPAIATRHKTYALALLAIVYTFNYVDRQILIILAEPIRKEFGLMDWQLGFLTGLAFALFYAGLGIPIARLADRGHRVRIVAASLALWSLMTAACGLASSFVQLVAARIGVGIGEAGGSPPAVSLLADLFDEKERAASMAVYSMGPTVGILLGFVIGGWINQWYGWRAAILTVGLPGLILAAAVLFTIREPARQTTATSTPSLGTTIRTLVGNRVCRGLNLAAAAAGFAVYGVMVWVPVLLIRKFGLSTGEVGTAIGLIAGIAGSIGVMGGGLAAGKLSARDPRWIAWTPALTTLLFAPSVLLALSATSAMTTLALLVPAYALALSYTGPTWAMLQNHVPAGMRATAAALLLFVVNLVGLGVGPQVIGILSDRFGSAGGADGLGTAIKIGTVASLVASALFFYVASGIPEQASGNMRSGFRRNDGAVGSERSRTSAISSDIP